MTKQIPLVRAMQLRCIYGLRRQSLLRIPTETLAAVVSRQRAQQRTSRGAFSAPGKQIEKWRFEKKLKMHYS